MQQISLSVAGPGYSVAASEEAAAAVLATAEQGNEPTGMLFSSRAGSWDRVCSHCMRGPVNFLHAIQGCSLHHLVHS